MLDTLAQHKNIPKLHEGSITHEMWIGTNQSEEALEHGMTNTMWIIAMQVLLPLGLLVDLNGNSPQFWWKCHDGKQLGTTDMRVHTFWWMEGKVHSQLLKLFVCFFGGRDRSFLGACLWGVVWLVPVTMVSWQLLFVATSIAPVSDWIMGKASKTFPCLRTFCLWY